MSGARNIMCGHSKPGGKGNPPGFFCARENDHVPMWKYRECKSCLTQFSARTEIDQGEIPEEARFVRRLGCPATRQFDVMELGGDLFMVEVATDANPTPGDHVVIIPTMDIFRQAATRVLKANDASEQ